MTIDGYTYDGWPIQPDYRTKSGPDDSAPLRRCPKHVDLHAALEIGRQLRTRSVVRRVIERITGD